MSLDLVLYIVAAVLFAIAAFANDRVGDRFNLVAAGLLAWVLTNIL